MYVYMYIVHKIVDQAKSGDNNIFMPLFAQTQLISTVKAFWFVSREIVLLPLGWVMLHCVLGFQLWINML